MLHIGDKGVTVKLSSSRGHSLMTKVSQSVIIKDKDLYFFYGGWRGVVL